MSEVRYETCPPAPAPEHEYARLFPLLLNGEPLEQLKADIKKNGILEPVVFLNDSILDGRNRYYIARELGIAYPRVEYEGEDPLGFVISLNLHRRHLNESQRSMVAAKLAKMPIGANQHSEGLPIGRASALLNVGERSIARAKEVQEDGAPELVAAVEAGTVSVSAAADVATLPQEEQREIVARGEKEILEAAKTIRAGRAVVKRTERIERIAEINKGNAELGTETKYPVIYADPPWRYENPPMGGTNRSIENHYPTMSLEEICAMPVGELAADDAMLYLWATAPKLAECMKVIEAWGFEYRTNLVWDKELIGMGYHARNQHEILLVAKRGEIPPPEAGKQSSSVHRERRTEHSAKPIFYYEMIEAAYPGLPKIELFCRSPREGWAVWGNQSGDADAA
jgi:N6-adenosine-specific RNA methylase IME4/ParB-like chromosome segregation protein Spo0J